MEQTVPCGHCLRRDSGQSIPAQRPTWDFPTLSLRSHSPPGEASCTQQQGAPPLTPRCPSGHTAGPGPAPLRAERPPLSQGLISVSEVEAKSPGAQCRIQIGIICGSVHIPGARPHMRTQGACLMGENRLTKRVCVHIPYTMCPCDTCVHHAVFITIHESTHPSPPKSHVLCVKTLTMYSPDKFPVCSNRIGLTTVSMLHISPQDSLISQLIVCTF